MSLRSAPKSRGWPRIAFLAMSALVLASVVPSLIAAGPTFSGYLGVDRTLYMDATERWLSGGPFYNPYQLAGPYPIRPGDILYPPVALWLFVPFTILPAVLWWIVPLGLTGWTIWRLRPLFIVWPFLALCVAWPPTIVKLATGNPVMWSMAAVALGLITVGPAVFALIKPSLFPFALWGVRRRRWWMFLAGFMVLSLPFGVLWSQWLTSLANSQGGGPFYSIQEVPMVGIAVIAWLGRDSRLAREAEVPRHDSGRQTG